MRKASFYLFSYFIIPSSLPWGLFLLIRPGYSRSHLFLEVQRYWADTLQTQPFLSRYQRQWVIYSGEERDKTAAGEDRRQVSLSFQERRLFYSDLATGTGSRWCFCPAAHSCSSPISTATCLPHCFLIPPLLHLILNPLRFSAKENTKTGKADRQAKRQRGRRTTADRHTGRSSSRAPGRSQQQEYLWIRVLVRAHSLSHGHDGVVSFVEFDAGREPPTNVISLLGATKHAQRKLCSTV